MALITCPDCCSQVSDKAQACIHCGCPLNAAANTGVIQLKLGMCYSVQKASVAVNGRTVWEGENGRVIELKLDGPSNVRVEYKRTWYDGAGLCEERIDPAKHAKWQVVAKPGVLSGKTMIQPVDIFDAD